MSITVVFDPPQPSDSTATFNTKAFQTLADLNTWSTQANALAGEMEDTIDDAAASASAALSSANTAADHASTAATQASNASSSASAAATSATNAANSATAANASAGSASDSVTAAAAQVALAATQVSLATTQASNAASSATAAASSATAASASAAAASAIVLGTTTGHPTVRPTLNLDFANSQTIDPRITFTRASTATRTNAQGRIESVASGTPRIDYDPVTLACKGLLIEEARTNLLVSSSDFRTSAEGNATAGWTEGTDAEQAVAKNVTGPDGVANSGTTITWTTPSAGNTRYQQVSKSSGETVAVSFFLKQGSTQYTALQCLFLGGTSKDAYVVINWNTKTISATGADAANVVGSVDDIGGGWYRLMAVHIDTGANTLCRFSVAPTQSNGTTIIDGTVVCYGAQLEAGSAATSYIPSGGAATTRAADVAVMTGANFSNWYRADEGTFVSYFDSMGSKNRNNDAILFTVSNSSDNYFPTMSVAVNDVSSVNRINSSIYGEAGTEQLSGVRSSVGSYTFGALASASFAYKSNDVALSVSGSSVFTDLSVTLPTTCNKLYIGQHYAPSVRPLNGHIRRLSYYPSRLPNAQLQALST